MELDVDKPLKEFVERSLAGFKRNISAFGSRAAEAYNAIEGMQLKVGLATSPSYQIDAGAIQAPVFVGDGKWVNKTKPGADIEALYKRGDSNVGMAYRWNSMRNRYDIHYTKTPGRVGDGLGFDAVGPILNGSALSPSAISWFQKPFVQPLTWSQARKFVNIEQGTSPWAEVMEMPVALFPNILGAINTAGDGNNTMSQDVEIQTGAIAQPIINIDVSYKLSIQELQRAQAEASSVPYVGQLISLKQSYAKYVQDLLTDNLIWYGNALTGNVGILDVVNSVDWDTANDTLTAIAADSGNTTKGSTAYQQLATAVASFLTTSQNKFTKVIIGVSPRAYNLLGSMPYSNAYNPNAALKILVENFLGGKGQEGVLPSIEIVPDPLLASSSDGNIFNAIAHDYMVITGVEIGGGPGDMQQPTLQFGAPLMDFVYPVIPQQMSTQYRMLRRVAGVFAPYTAAVKVYTNYGS